MPQSQHYDDDFEDEDSYIFCDTSAGEFTLTMHRAWSPNGYDRAVELFERGYYDGSHFFRVVPGFLVQFGISYTSDHELRNFADKTIPDDPQLEPRIPFEEGTISYAGSGPNSRSSQLFIAYAARQSFGTELWETPLGKVTEGLEVVRKFNSEYGDMPPWGHGPVQHKIRHGAAYIEEEYPHLDYFIHCRVQREPVHTAGVDEELEHDLDGYDQPLDTKEVGDGAAHASASYESASHASAALKVEQDTDRQQSVVHHVAMPIAAALATFFILMYALKKGRKKMTAKVV